MVLKRRMLLKRNKIETVAETHGAYIMLKRKKLYWMGMKRKPIAKFDGVYAVAFTE